MKKKLVLPKFKNEDEEREFWLNLDLAEHFEPEDFVPVSFPNLKPTSHAISIRIPDYILDSVKEKANSLNIPYQSLIKIYIAEGLDKEKKAKKRTKRSSGKKSASRRGAMILSDRPARYLVEKKKKKGK